MSNNHWDFLYDSLASILYYFLPVVAFLMGLGSMLVVSSTVLRRKKKSETEKFQEATVRSADENMEMVRASEELESLRVSSRANRYLTIISAVGGLIGIAVAITRFDAIKGIFKKLGSLDIFSTAAMAQGAHRADLSEVAPYFLAAILGIMALAFLASVLVALTTTTAPSTIGKRRTADNIIKMTGGFFVGFGMALLK